jgi:ABC-type phosphate transport system substrate-binding protein
MVRRALQTAVVGGVVAASLLSTVLPAQATVLPPTTRAVTATGSDTTENFMKDYLTGKTSSNDGSTSYTVQTYNIPAFPSASGYSVDEDVKCPSVPSQPGYTGTINWVPTGTAGQPPFAPSGSGAGRTMLKNQRAVGSPSQSVACVDIGRSSSKGDNSPTGTEAGFEYYGFALDAVSWATTSLKAPATLTRQQVKDIYNCVDKDWKDVGGVPGPIQRYIPQASSGTYQFFLTEFLDLPSNGAPPSVPGCADAIQIDKNGNPFEENQGNTIKDADIDKAIFPYSGGVWAFQKNNSSNPTLDKRNGARLGGIVTAPTSGTPTVQNVERWNGTNVKYELDYVNTNNPAGVVADTNNILTNSSFSHTTGFPGVRFLFNVVDSLNTQSYGPAVGLVGFDNTASPLFKSPLCSNGARTLILSYGFAPLPTVTSTFNQPNGDPTTDPAHSPSSCRKF